MKTAEQFLREAFGDKANQLNQNVEFLKDYHFGQYPDSVQRTYIYEAMRLVSEEKDRRIRELEEELLKCEKTFGLIWKILDTLHNANSDDLQHLVDNIDIDLPIIQARIKDVLNPPKP